MKLSLAPAAPFLVAAALAAPLFAQAPAAAPQPAAVPQVSSASQAPASVAGTPRDPKSPIPGFADGRGPTGPVQMTIVSPKQDEVIPIPAPAAGQAPPKGAPVTVKLELQNFEIFQDAATQTGQHVHIVLDNLPYFAYFDLTKPWVFKSIPKGTHTLRIFPARSWHESIKEPGAFAMVTFHVGEKDGKYAPVPGAPLLTWSRPKGKYPAAEAQKILFDFYVTNCTVAAKSVPGSCQVRYRLDDRPEVTVDRWEPMWWEGLAPGKHEYVIGLTRDDKVVENGSFNLLKASFEIEAAGAGDLGKASGPGGASTAPASAGAQPAPAAPATH
jgi:hypothetical protein